MGGVRGAECVWFWKETGSQEEHSNAQLVTSK